MLNPRPSRCCRAVSRTAADLRFEGAWDLSSLFHAAVTAGRRPFSRHPHGEISGTVYTYGMHTDIFAIARVMEEGKVQGLRERVAPKYGCPGCGMGVW